jgi:hypothetical protein
VAIDGKQASQKILFPVQQNHDPNDPNRRSVLQGLYRFFTQARSDVGIDYTFRGSH